MILRILLAVVIVQVAIMVFLAVLSWKLFSHQHDMSSKLDSITLILLDYLIMCIIGFVMRFL